MELSQVYHTVNRFRLVNEITEQLKDFGNSIDNVLVRKFGSAADLEGTMNLLRVAVYCFLAEMHRFTHNEFYSEAFTFEVSTEKE